MPTEQAAAVEWLERDYDNTFPGPGIVNLPRGTIFTVHTRQMVEILNAHPRFCDLRNGQIGVCSCVTHFPTQPWATRMFLRYEGSEPVFRYRDPLTGRFCTRRQWMASHQEMGTQGFITYNKEKRRASPWIQ